MAKITNVLSLFDGLSCGQIALKELGIIPNKYYASEIDKHAIAQTQLNFPNTIQLGSVVDVDVSKLEPIDMILAGSPCTNFSAAGKRNGMSTVENEEIYTLDRYLQLKEEGFQFEGQSYLFWEFMRILTDIRKYNPNVKFLLENVEMGDKWERVLSEAIGVFGVHINSALVSAQNRKRIYFTNIRVKQVGLFGELYSDIPQPKDEGILLKDILEENVDEKYYLSENMLKNCLTTVQKDNHVLQIKEATSKGYAEIKPGECFDFEQPNSKTRRGRKMSEKSNSLMSQNMSFMYYEPNSNNITINNYKDEKRENKRRTRQILYLLRDKVNSKENEKWEMAVYARFFKDEILFNRLYENIFFDENIRTKDNKEREESGTEKNTNDDLRDMQNEARIGCSPQRQEPVKQFTRQLATCLQRMSQQDTSTENDVFDMWEATKRIWLLRKALSEIQKIWESIDGETKPIHNGCRIRRLTPTEAARLQTIPEWYKWACSDTQQYKLLGNGWNIETVKHIFKFMK